MEPESDKMAEKLLKDIDSSRHWRSAMYLGLVFSGICFSIDPSRAVSEQVSGLVAIVWGVAITVSAAICLWGALTDMWIGEYTGIPLLSAALFMAGLAAFFGFEKGGPFIVGYGILMVSFSLGLLSRRSTLKSIKNASNGGEVDKGV